MNKKVLLGMSGGVDSSVSAVLLKQAGYEVIGCTMRLWEEKQEQTEQQSILDAKKVCEKLGIQHIVVDFRHDFECHVIQNFIEEYESANTPNPCVECNRALKFGKLYEKARELGCDYIATGHYARIGYSEKYHQMVLQKSSEEKKDQTYFLYTIKKDKLSHILFPLQEYTEKEKIRNLAEEHGLLVAKKKDSQEICFIPNNDYQTFLQDHQFHPEKEGDIILANGKKLGKHTGLTHYTIGQRKGLGIAYQEPLYVTQLEREKNQVIVGTEQELYQSKLMANQINWLVESINTHEPISCLAKIRYRAKEAKATIYPKENGSIEVVFEEPQRAITPGQSVVFYDKEGIVLGGGKIIRGK